MEAEASGSYLTQYLPDGRVLQNANDWYAGVIEACANLAKTMPDFAKRIIGIGVAGIGWSVVPVDAHGDPISPVSIWLDTSATQEVAQIRRVIDDEQVFRVAGNPLMANYLTPKLLKYKNEINSTYAKTSKFLNSNSYISYRLTGIMTQEYSQSYGYHFFDIRRRVFAADLCVIMGLDPNKMPDLTESHAVIGTVTDGAAKETGLLVGTPVVAGGLDAACAALGVGAISEGDTQEQGGQAGGMGICTDTCIPNRQLITGCHVVPGKWLLQGGTVGGGNALRWLKDGVLFDQNRSFLLLDSLAESVPQGAGGLTFLPYLQGERSPIWDTEAKGIFHGISYRTTKAHFVRAVMEGVAYSLRHNLETAQASGVEVRELLSTGGASQSPLWMQIKSNVCGLPLKSTKRDIATPLGAALLAGVGIGLYPDFSNAVKRTVQYAKTYFPDRESHEFYSDGYQKYLAIYQRLKGL